MSELHRELAPSPRLRRARKKASKATALSFCLGLLALVLSLSIPYILYKLYRSVTSALHKLGNPHISHYHNLTSDAGLGELGVVKSYFDGGEEGVQCWDLVANLYWRRQRDSRDNYDKRIHEDMLEQMDNAWMPWERLFSDVAIKDINGKEAMSPRAQPVHGTKRVVLPGRVLPYLRQPYDGLSTQLVSTFYLLPSSRTPPPHLHPQNSTTPSASFSEYSESMNRLYTQSSQLRFPLPYPAQGNSHASQSSTESSIHPNGSHHFTGTILKKYHGWEVLLSNAPAIGSMLKPFGGEANATRSPTAKGTEVYARMGGTDDGKMGQEGMVIKSSWVAMAKDAPVYTLEAFRKRMKKLGERHEHCTFLGLPKAHEDPHCWRRFVNVGHFESLIAVGPSLDPLEVEVSFGKQADGTGWRYTPFLTSRLGIIGDRDVVALPNGTFPVPEDEIASYVEPDFSYDWNISFSTVSPLKLAFGLDISESLSVSVTGDDWQYTGSGANSFLEHPSAPQTRPLLRFALKTLYVALYFPIFALNGYYWYTRTLTAAIAIPSQLIDLALGVFWPLVFIARGEYEAVTWSLNLVFRLGMFFVVGSLGLRLEWIWWARWIPVGVARRRPTRSEKKSAREDLGGFRWTARGILYLSIFLVYNLLSPPPLLSSPSTIPTSVFHSSPVFTAPFTARKLFRSLSAPLWLSLFVPQFLLNYRLRTFGGSHRLASILQLLQKGLEVVPGLLVREKWEGMEEVRAYGLVTLGTFAAVAWQATRYPAMNQEEEEEEEG